MTAPVALITAAANGIGAATAAAFARAGYRLALADTDAEGLSRLRDDLPGPPPVLATGDLTTESGAAAAVEAAITGYGELSTLVNVVGGSRPGQTTPELTLGEWNRWLALNLTSVFLMCRAALPHLERGTGSRGEHAAGSPAGSGAGRGAGTIVNVSSGAGLRGMRANPAYCAAKAGVVGLTRALAIDHGPAGVRVNAVAPGPVRTPLMERNRTPDEIAGMGRVAVLGRVADPAEIAAAILWLAGDASSYVTGQTMEVDGGVAALV